MYSSGREFYDFPLEQSLRFEDGDSAYLSRTPTTAGNQKTFTISAWVKRTELPANYLKTRILTCGTSLGTNLSNSFFFGFDSDESLRVYQEIGGATSISIDTNAKYRDVSAWLNVICSVDTTQATASDRLKLYVNGEQVTSLASSTYPALNTDCWVNDNSQHWIGRSQGNEYSSFYLAEYNLIDGQALDASSFGEFKSGIWIPKDTSGLTYGTNGFRLNFADTVEASGFNTVTWTGNNTNGGNSINGVGFSPDLVWAKCRSVAYSPLLYDSIRGTGATAELKSDGTEVEGGSSSSERGYLNSFDSDGFSSVVGSNGDNLYFNQSGQTYVAWCWDAGSGSPVSNTDGSVTTTVKANPDYGFSVVSYNGSGTTSTFGHGLNSPVDCMIIKRRNGVANWIVKHKDLPNYNTTGYIQLDTTSAYLNDPNAGLTGTDSTTFTISNGYGTQNASGGTYIAYCFAEKTGYSKISSFSGTGSSGNSVSGLGFAPAFVMIKRSDAGGEWAMYDNTRQTSNPKYQLRANAADAENSNSVVQINFDSDGFTLNTTDGALNGSGGTYLFMAFKDTRDAAFWRDVSGQGNDWQPNNLTFSDVVPDGTNNFCTLNSVMRGNGTFSQGNLRVVGIGGNYDNFASTFIFDINDGNGWYWEWRSSGNDDNTEIGVAPSNNQYFNQSDPTNPVAATSGGVAYRGSGQKKVEGSNSNYGSSWTSGDIIGVAVKDGKVWFAKNGTWQNSGDPAAGTNPAATGLSGDYVAAFSINGTNSGNVNFGQDSTFAGNKAAGGNADENGYGDFAYAPPDGALSLCSSNLPTGAIDTLADETPEDYFNTVLWTGTSAEQSITGVNFQPSLTWIKERSQVRDHVLFDAVRGFDGSYLNRLYSNQTWSESTYAPNTYGGITSFDADGFTVNSTNASYIFTNTSGETYVGWNWKANGAGVSNTDGSITSTVSASETSQGNKWFSVVKWTGNGTAGATVGHGLSSQPRLIITKNMSVATDWSVLAQDANNGSGHLGYIRLNLTSAWAATSILWNNTEPTSSVFTLGSYGYVNGSGNDIIGYCFANAENLCKVGSYTGNGSTDGTFVFTGHKPSFLLIKETGNANSWELFDTARDPDNVASQRLFPNDSAAEATTNPSLDILSNGFKARAGNTGINRSGGSYIFLSIASQPFKYANAR